jgi:transcriptional regulator with XRE-family HTH domain
VSRHVAAAVGRRIRELRQRLGVSQETLAERAGLHRNSIGNIERGERDIHISALFQIAGGLGVTLAECFAPFTQSLRRKRV